MRHWLLAISPAPNTFSAGHSSCRVASFTATRSVARWAFPTANVQHARARLPLSGIYAVTVEGLGKTVFGAASVGVRPTIAEGLKPVLEVHLLDFDRDIYGEHVHVNFHHKLRDEAKYASLEALTAQIARDVEDTRNYFEHADWHKELDE